MASLRLVAALSRGSALSELSQSAQDELDKRRWRRRPLGSLQLTSQLAAGDALDVVYGAAMDGRNAADREKNVQILNLWWEVEDLGQKAQLLKAEASAMRAGNDAKESRLRPQREAAGLAEQYQHAENELRKARLRLEACTREREMQERIQELKSQECQNQLLEVKNKLSHEKVEAHRNATEDVLLLRLLHAEVDKWRAIALELETKADLQAKEEAKDNILLGLLNAQLFTDRENIAALRKEDHEHAQFVARLEASVEHAHGRISELLKQRDDLEFHAAQTHSEREAAGRRLEARTKREETHIRALEIELAAAQERYHALVEKMDAQERTRADCQSKLLAKVSSIKATGGDVFFAKREVEETAIAAEGRRIQEINKLGIAIETVQKKMEMLDTRTFETTVKGTSDIDLMTEQHLITQKAIAALEAESSVKLSTAREQIASVKSTHKAVQEAAAIRERQNFEMITKLAAANEVLKARVVALQKSATTRNDEHVGERISVASETSKHYQAKMGMEAALKKQRQGHMERMAVLEKDKAKWSTEGDEVACAAEIQKLAAQRRQALKEGGALAKEHDSLADNHMKKERFTQDRFVAYEAEIKGLNANIRNLKKTCEQLEAKVTETLTYRERAMANEDLEVEVDDCKVQIRHLTNVISTMKVEKGLLDGYKARVLQEQNEVHRNKLEYLEQTRHRLIPLLRELLSTAKLHGLDDDAVDCAEQAAIKMGVKLTPAIK